MSGTGTLVHGNQANRSSDNFIPISDRAHSPIRFFGLLHLQYCLKLCMMASSQAGKGSTGGNEKKEQQAGGSGAMEECDSDRM